MDYYQKTGDELLTLLKTSFRGLDSEEARQRLTINGFNQLETKNGLNPLVIFLNQFKNFIIYILLFAVFFSILIGEYVDTTIILAILITNALIGFFQELSAHRSLEALKKMSATMATVIRNGKKDLVDSRYLVPGDMIRLAAGDKVPADTRIIEAIRLKVEESVLTGESVPVEKDCRTIFVTAPLGNQRNMLFASTTVATGHGLGVVVATGMKTELGKITTLIKEAVEEMTPLQRRLDHFGKKLGYAIIGICFFIFSLSFFRGYYADTLSMQSIVGFAFIAISLAVAAVPTALPAVVTIALSIGVKRLLKRKALVRNLSSVETLGSCDVICTDKTGTLTENQMTVRCAWTLDSEATLSGVGYAPDGELSGKVPPQLFLSGLLCNNASLDLDGENWRITGDPTEAALLVSAAKAGVSASVTRSDEIPFDSERKMMSVLVSDEEDACIYSKGALDSLLKKCTRALVNGREVFLSPEFRQRIEAQNSLFASKAMRVLGFAMKRLGAGEKLVEEDLTFIGLQAMIDPPRPDVIESMGKTKQAGIRVIMITGDYGETAQAIGNEIGICSQVLTGEELGEMDDGRLKMALTQGTNIFARVAPEHKQRIIHNLQEMEYTVAMAGDGVNDAPALKKANIGVAVGSGTDVAKEAADFVLLDDSFTHIVNAIEEGRGIYDNIQKSIMLLLSGNLGEVLIIFLAAISGMNLPLTAILLLWINMVTDGAPALAYSVDPYGRDVMLRKPKPRREGILPRSKLIFLIVLGILGTLIALTVFYLYGGTSASAATLIHAQTMVFNFVVLYEIILTFVIRCDYQVSFFANKWVWGAAVLSILLQALLMYTPLASAFKIVPLDLKDIATLLLAGGLFGLGALFYQSMKWKFSGPFEKKAP
jgi:P-type Ca2+ transporter type 2C